MDNGVWLHQYYQHYVIIIVKLCWMSWPPWSSILITHWHWNH